MSEANDNRDVLLDEAADPNRTIKIIGIILIALVVMCICVIAFIFLLPVIATAILALLGPAIGNVFSEIIIGI